MMRSTFIFTILFIFVGLTDSIALNNKTNSNGVVSPVLLAASDESFESGLGGWTQSSSDDMDWSRRSGGTPSSSTGPSGAYDGSYYIYTESSSPNFPSKTAIITSPSYDVSSISAFTFNYHMYGATIGSIQLQISSNGGGSWGTIWSKSGNQGTSWQSYTVNLSNTTGSQMFRFVATTGSNYTGDIALDNFVFTTSAGCNDALSLSNTENYVFTRTYQNENGDVTDAIEQVTYFDGLGRPKQQVGIGHGNEACKDLVTHVAYDQYGRQTREYLPYVETGSSGSFRTGDIDENTRNYYDAAFPDDFNGVSTANPFSESQLEASPLSRPEKQAAPGYDWRLGGGHEVEMDYQTNTSSEVRNYQVSLTYTNGIYEPTLSSGGYYATGELYKTITKDENHTSGTAHTTEEFTDKQGRVVLKRTYADSDNNGDGDTTDSGETNAKHDTYYVYDDYGNLTYVLPPKVIHDSISTTEKNELCYQYKYDRRNRLAEKKVPGKGWEYIVYNKLDQPVLTQDANMRGVNSGEPTDQWLFTKYDAFGRVAYTGYISNSNGRSNLQGTFDGATYNYEQRQTSSRSLGGTNVYYTNNAKPQTSISEIYTINYYDSYDNLNIGFTIPNSNSLGETIIKGMGTKGLATVTKTRVLGTSQWITTAMGYDSKGRVVWTKTYNPFLGTTDIVAHDLDFTGTVLQTKTTHQKTGKSDIVTIDTYDYDHMKRLKKHTQTINGSTPEMITENDYDELGQLENKGVGNVASDSTRLQDIEYSYNVRGWLKSINDIGNTDKLFNFQLSYNDPSSGTPLFNGNISRADWRTDNTDSNLKYYRYYYDDLNRITSATAHNSAYNLSGVTYDKNGNIQKLKRGSSGAMDNLTYDYNNSDVSNRLRRVSDIGNTNGFEDGTNTGDDYMYDPNGNLTSDANKGITNITYNHLNLPVDVEFNGSSSQTIHYAYDATGVKLRKVIPGKTTDYAGNFIYEGGTLQFFSTSEGYVSYDNGQFNYVYNYVDHLGNVRLSYTDGDHNGSIDPATEIIQEKNYYPFGLTHQGYNGGGSSYGNDAAKRYGFGGKELQDETFSGNTLDWYDVSARNYDPALGRWMNIDPLAEQMRRHSPYNYAFNNPLYWIDPDGMAPTDWYQNLDNGNIEWHDGSAEKEGYVNLGKATDVAVGKGYSLQDNGVFTDNNTGKTYGKGDELAVGATGVSIESNGSFLEETQTYVNHNKDQLLSIADDLQTAGDGIAVTGYGAAVVGSAVAGVGAAPGATIAGIGNGVSMAGSLLEFGVNLITADYGAAAEEAGFIIGGEVIHNAVDRLIPGPTPNMSEEVSNGINVIRTNLNTMKPVVIERGYEKIKEGN
ncbi:DUF6443 domain-containing protein [Gramella sp. GC03-9]|uniref:DUF6443 domain-containing protein n=1 Tax=Christiangramia oceanisediminis TaxID=2920386 RepID=A0A9X2KZX5_9FLAO|nr:DUF6443 domain-containing protein [Gramella oceanisediminis]MCP9201291.1 DUF6443 domain-containing protein [Gramella oceanisediminis]